MPTVSLSQLLASYNFVGYTGSQGTLGYTGSQGVGFAGSQGPQGTTGFTGSLGGTGFVGSRGDTGLGFSIVKTYPSVAALAIDTTPTGIVAGQFALIDTGTVEDPENSRLYLWSGTAYSYVSDLSGAAGITGPQGTTGFTGSASTEIGFTGSAGPQGTTGFTGSIGAGGVTYAVTANGASDYVINGQNDPTLTLIKGFTYYFAVNATGHPFWIKTAAVTGTGSAYSSGVTNNGTAVGTVTFTVPFDAPATLYYICQFHSAMVGTLNIVDSMQGYTGSQGTTGFVGSAGNTGFTGSTGAGFTGSQGTTGFVGSAGGTGFTGSAGAAGAVGFTGSAGGGGGGGGNGYTGSQGLPGTLASGMVTNTFTGDGTTTVYTLTVAPVSIDATLINIDGVAQQKSTYTLSGRTLTFSEAPAVGESIEVAIITYGTTNFVTRTYTGNGTTANYAVTDGSTVDSVIVTENGIIQTPTSDYTISGNVLTFTTPPLNNNAITIREIPAGSGSTVYSRTSITATAGQTSFAVAYNIGYIAVYFNGALLNSVDYTASNGSTVVLTDAAAAGDIVEFITYNLMPVTAVPVATFNSTNLTANLAITAGYSAVSVGPINIANGVRVAIANGQKWVIL